MAWWFTKVSRDNLSHWLISTQTRAALLQALLGLLEHVRFAAREGVERRRAVRGAGNDSGEPCAGLGPSCSFEDT